MASVVTFGQLPEEEPDFIAYVQKTGDVWARAVRDDAESLKCEPLPVVEFLSRFAGEIKAYTSVDVYLEFREDVLHPRISIHEVIEGGTEVPLLQNGRTVQGVHTIVGGIKVKRKIGVSEC